MLIGTYSSVLSPKRRTAIPKKFLKELGQQLILARWYEGCLVLVNQASWKALLQRLTGQEKIITDSVRETDRFILGSAFEAEPDDQGRVIIPKHLAEYALLGERLAFVGLADRVEIWDSEQWKNRENYITKHASEFLENLAGTKKGEAGDQD